MESATDRRRHIGAIARRIALSLAVIFTALLVLIPLAERLVIGEPVWPPLHFPIPVLIHGTVVDLRLMPIPAIIAWLAWLVIRINAKPEHRAAKPVRVLVALFVTLLLLVESVISALPFFAVERMHVLAPTSPNGCTIIATYSSALWSSNGDFLIVPRGHMVPRSTDAGWTHRDGSANDPFGDPTWTVTWNGDDATLVPNDTYLVSTYRTPVHCE
ncbi:hypothetical protein [Bifidobacterium avesanii]|uniref:Uncharacterized protein n=1 Tax=Bifidobacterium avesanii TaxID=1798157 RepID=A0A7K3TJ08_9BIFI|nr:hypothetical protein [Bifidobacterium avesanii]KAB8292003.1 hypothetical protein DSM100685_1015 [Bifidobacterium avesanii]NEG78634.1 hypothetical protein [Bifidobacterium avesanii]